MPILAAVAVLLPIVLVGIVLIPISFIQRYRVGTSRQRARGWLATMNVVAIGLSTALLLLGAAVTTIWAPRAFPYTLLGLALGAMLGLAGLWLTRWEHIDELLHFTPNRWLVLAILFAVGARITYSFWRRSPREPSCSATLLPDLLVRRAPAPSASSSPARCEVSAEERRRAYSPSGISTQRTM